MLQQALVERLAEPFASHEVKWKAQVVRGNRALAVTYVDARAVEDRLDAIFGVDGWQDAYQVLPNNNVVCKLRIRIGDEWIEKSDVGSQSDQPDEGDRMKSAFSDALKRAAVKLGIGRYLYRLPQQWTDYDATTRQLRQTPKLPEWALGRDERPAERKPERKMKVAAETETISRSQWDQIKSNLVQNGISQRKFLEHFHVQKPGELPAEHFGEALQRSQQPQEAWRLEPAPAA